MQTQQSNFNGGLLGEVRQGAGFRPGLRSWLAGLTLALTVSLAHGQWVAINDVFNGPLTHPNVTTYGTVAQGVSITGSGFLKDLSTGQDLSARLEIYNENVVPAGTMGTPNQDTPAMNMFGPYVDWSTASGGQNAVYLDSTSDVIYYRFTGLNPAARYSFHGTAVRGNSGYTIRWTRVTLLGAESFDAANLTGPSSPGILDAQYPGSGLGPNEVAFNPGYNVVAGDVVGWTNIDPGADGEIIIVCRVYTGPIPAGTAATVSYGFNALRLEELMSGPIEIVRQPETNVVVEAFSPWSLSVETLGGGPQYQWYRGTPGNAVAIEGATRRTYSVPSAMLSDSGTYFAVIRNQYNAMTTTVSTVTVFVNPIQITQQPTNRLTILELRPLNLSVGVTGTRPQFQWYKNGQAIPDATNQTFTIASAVAADSGNYYVVVTNLLYGATSTVAQVIVSSDIAPPQVVRIVPNTFHNQVIVEFDEAVDPGVAGNGANYTPSMFDVYSVVLTNDRTAVLFTSPLAPNTDYNLDIFVQDLVNNFDFLSTSFRTWTPNLAGGVMFDVYYTGGGTAITNLLNHTNFPHAPDSSFVLTNFDTTVFWPDASNGEPYRQNYGARMRGFFIPVVSGNYHFFIRSDDASELYVNPNGPSADGKVRVAYETGCCNAFQEPGTAIQTSTNTFALVAGRPYYVEAVYKEGTGGDWCQVAARRVGDPTPANQLVPILETGVPYLPPGLYGQNTFLAEPQDITRESPASFTLSALAANSLNVPLSYQWQRNDGAGFVDIPNARGRNLSFTNVTVAENGAQFRVIVAAGDTAITSRVATVTITPDVTGPQVVNARREANLTTITINFTEPLDPVNATTVGNYQVCDAFVPNRCLNILGATLTNNNTTVILDTEMPDLAGTYQLRLSGVTDVHGNVIRPPTTVPLRIVASFQEGLYGYTGAQDTQLRQANPDDNYNTATSLLVDASDGGGVVQVLVAFRNLFGTGPGQIPPGVTLRSATLRLFSIDANADTPGPVYLHLMLVPWDSANVTYNSLTAGVATNGVEATTNNYGSIVPNFPNPNGTTWQTRDVDVLSSLQAWASGQVANNGWVLINVNTDGYRFSSSEYSEVQYRPLLMVEYEPGTEVQPVQIVSQPAPTTTVNEGAAVNLSVSVSGTRPEFQWYKDGQVLSGATNATLTLANVNETFSGRYFCIVSNFAPSIVQSADAVVVVNPDTNRPVVVSALATTNLSEIRVVFNKPMNAASLAQAGRFVVAPAYGGAPLNVLGVALATNGLTATITTEPRNAFTYYTLTVRDVTDVAYRQNVLAPNPTWLILGSQISLIAPISEWKFFQNGDAGAGWTAPAFDDSGWSNGLALFVGKTGTPGQGDIPIATSLAMGQTTYYFRGRFNLPSLAQLSGLQSFQIMVRPIIDDGAVFHLNGQEALRVGMTNAGPIFYETFATRSQGNDYRWEGPYALPVANLVFGGQNVIAVEVHQVNATSSDVAFAAELLINVPPVELRLQPAVVNGDTFRINWPPLTGFRLYQADRVEGPYSPVPGDPVGTYSVSTRAAQGKFFQVRREP
ncbi:immunoglobulin domain-containing protein [Fontisphaera persica]|uniref:immunoglobulin domain-containing protein n=1 Tax=Fontisphaera persica TaxID=2974023 RepID=UPI0024C0A369|nr:immunoglobulin domain-containing protein [Fontisphaera persica]WCJ61180.1 immunoglobulin domain-containing protein [Fontisphaera persica]